METIKDVIYHSKTEKRSFLLLIFIIAVLSIAKQQLTSLKSIEVEDLCYLEDLLQPDDNKTLDKKILKRKDYKNDDSRLRKEVATISTTKKNQEFKGKVNPNTANEDSLKLLGISTFAINNLIKYRAKGGKIKNPEELKKIYGIDSSTFKDIQDNISIPKPSDPILTSISTEIPKVDNKPIDTFSFAKAKEEKKKILIDVNTADEIQLQYINGIGPSYAKRIVKYRALIGGYHSKNQLLEVYGLDRQKLDEIKDQITVGDNIEKLDVNSIDYKSISSHPYISHQEARLIVAYTKKHGSFKNAYDIVKIGVMDSLFVEKILPYLPDSLVQLNAHTPLTSL